MLADAAEMAQHHAPKDANGHAKKIVDALEAKLPYIPAYQRARGVHAWVGPPRKSIASRVHAIEKNLRLLEKHNALYEANKTSYFLAWNPLSDLSDDEYRAFLTARPDPRKTTPFHLPRPSIQVPAEHHTKPHHQWMVQQMNGVTIALRTTRKAASANATDDGSTLLPKNWNWQDIEDGKFLTPIKNQGTCGSCWAFSAVSVIESRYAIDNNVTATPLSVEQVLSCSAPLDHLTSKFLGMAASSKGCDGGMPFLAFEYMSRVAPNGIACDAEYPYVMATQVLETQCQSVATSKVTVRWQNGVSDYVPIASQSEEALMRAVYHGPVSSNMDAEGAGFRNYGGGIYDAKDCKSDGKDVNHAVVIVGYGETEQGDKYWVVRNTWGTMWGENGYIRIRRGDRLQEFGPCNMYLYSSYPTKLAKGEAHEDGVCPTPSVAFEELGWAKLLGYDAGEWGILLGSSLACVVLGVAFLVVTEYKKNRRDAAGQTTYEDNYDRWVLPTKEQIAAMLAKRRPQRESV